MAEYENGKGSRPLPYPLGDNEFAETVSNPTGAVTNTTPDFFPYDEPDEEIDLHFRMSMSQFTAIASAIDIGRDIGYGERSYELWRTWCKALIGEITVACEDIADCIEEQLPINTGLQDAVFNYVNNSGFGNPNSVSGSNTTVLDKLPVGAMDKPVKLLENCDLNAMWGGIRHGIVQRLDDSARDLLEDLAGIPNAVERLAIFIDVVPVVGDIAEGLAFQVTEVIPDLLDLYNAHSSEEALDEIACGLFSLVCELCRFPTFQEVVDYYAARSFGAGNFNDMTLDVVAQKLLDVILEPAETAYFTVAMFELLVLNLDAVFAGLTGQNAMVVWAEIGQDFANDNWLTLCETCDETYQEVVWDFANGQQGWRIDTLAPIVGKWGGSYWETTNDATSANMRLKVSRLIPRTAQVMAYKMEWEVVSGATTFFNRTWKFRPTIGSDSGSSQVGQGACTNTEAGWTASGNDLTTMLTNFAEMVIDVFGQPKTSPVTVIRLHRITLVFNRGFGIDDEMTLETDREICT